MEPRECFLTDRTVQVSPVCAFCVEVQMLPGETHTRREEPALSPFHRQRRKPLSFVQTLALGQPPRRMPTRLDFLQALGQLL